MHDNKRHIDQAVLDREPNDQRHSLLSNVSRALRLLRSFGFVAHAGATDECVIVQTAPTDDDPAAEVVEVYIDVMHGLGEVRRFLEHRSPKAEPVPAH